MSYNGVVFLSDFLLGSTGITIMIGSFGLITNTQKLYVRGHWHDLPRHVADLPVAWAQDGMAMWM